MTETIRDSAHHLQLCLDEHRSSSNYGHRGANVAAVQIERLSLDSHGYTRAGCYRGVGAPLFCAEFYDSADEWLYSAEFRAPSRAKLRAELKALYPLAKIGR